MAELDGELCRLALLLQPQYKLIAVPDGNVSPLIHKVQTQLNPPYPIFHIFPFFQATALHHWSTKLLLSLPQTART